jgi:hypothetical protein
MTSRCLLRKQVNSRDTSALIQIGRGLLDQQMWCWGRDIRYPGGNVLCRYGILPHRPAHPDRGSTAYVLALCPKRMIVLWGFGLFYGDAERAGMFLKRYEFTPRLTSQHLPPWVMWNPGCLPALRDPRLPDERIWLQGCYTDALHWIASYEQWIAQRFGLKYRRRCVAWYSSAIVSAEAMAATWKALAEGPPPCIAISDQ